MNQEEWFVIAVGGPAMMDELSPFLGLYINELTLAQCNNRCY